MTPSKNSYVTQISTYRYPDKTYRMGEKTMQGSIEKNESVRQAIYHILNTERYSNPIYGKNYGVELEKYLNTDIEYIRSTIQDTLSDALLQDDRITDVTVDSVEQTGYNSVLVTFTVATIYGKEREELEVVQQ